jgi:hypothetical protein
MIRVLCIDRSYPVVAQLVRSFANAVAKSDIHILFLSDKEPSGINGNLETINIFDIPQQRSLEELQATYSFSLHKTLVTERSFYDYSSFRRSQCYSRLSEEQIAERVTPFANAFDFAMREKNVDLVLEWFPDVFIPSLAGKIAGHYGKPFKILFPSYWWSDGAIFVDRMDMTSTEVDYKYRYYYEHPELCDHEKLDKIFKEKKTLFVFSSSQMYTWSMRVRQVLNKRKSYEPPSLQNWIVRRVSRVWSRNLIRVFIRWCHEPQDEPFVIYPIHVSPEASLLGTYPELADQSWLIKNISMNLPYGVKLYVKEHPNQDVGLGLDYDFYRRIATLPNVRMFASTARLDKLIDHPRCIAVAVLSGTVALDAAIKRKPVFIFGRAIFAAANCFLKPSNFDEFYTQLLAIIRGEFQFDDQALYAMFNALDASVVRADVDFQTCVNSTALVMSFSPIWRSYIESLAWKKKYSLETINPNPKIPNY